MASLRICLSFTSACEVLNIHQCFNYFGFIAAAAYFSDRGRLFQSDRGRRFSAIVDAQGCAQARV